MANKNNLISGLTAANINASATSISVSFDTDTTSGNATASSSSDALPNVPFYATISPAGVIPNLLNSEIVSVTAKTWDSGNSRWNFTITRAQKNTTARAFAQGCVFSNGVYTDDVDGKTETLTIATTGWSALSSSDPYTYSATVAATNTIGATSLVELLNDDAVNFATYGFAIGSISGQNITIYSIGQPSANVSLKINIKG